MCILYISVTNRTLPTQNQIFIKWVTEKIQTSVFLLVSWTITQLNMILKMPSVNLEMLNKFILCLIEKPNDQEVLLLSHFQLHVKLLML